MSKCNLDFDFALHPRCCRMVGLFAVVPFSHQDDGPPGSKARYEITPFRKMHNLISAILSYPIPSISCSWSSRSFFNTPLARASTASGLPGNSCCPIVWLAWKHVSR